jgi:DNA-binding response OmpR family regulator
MKENKILRTGAWASAPPQRQPKLRQRILVVDDDPLIRRLNSEVLIYSGYQVDTADDGATAWDALLVNHYDLLITDNDMPKMTGVDLLRHVYAARMIMPAIMATGTLPAGEFAKFPWLHPAVVMLKPYTFDELLEMVEEVLCTTAAMRAEITLVPGCCHNLAEGVLRS